MSTFGEFTDDDLEAAFRSGFGDPPDSSAEEGEGGVGPSPLDSPDPATESFDDDGELVTEPAVDVPVADEVLEPAEPTFEVVEGGPDIDDPAPAPADELPAPPPVDLNEVVSGYLGKPIEADDARSVLELMRFASDLQSLPPEAQQTIAQILQTRQVPVQAPTQSAPAPAAPTAPADPWADDLDPAPAPTTDPRIEAELAEMRAWRAQQEAATAQQHQQWVASEAKAAADEFLSSAPVPLTESELIVLEQKAIQSGEFGLEMQRTGGTDPRSAWKATLERTFWSDERLRQRVIDAQAQQRVATVEADQARQRRAASVSAGGGAVPSPAEMSAPRDMGDAMERAAADVAKLMANGQPPG